MKFPGILVLGVIILLKGVTQFCGVSKSQALFCLEFSGVNQKP